MVFALGHHGFFHQTKFDVDKMTQLSVYLIDFSDVPSIRTLAENIECELSPDLTLNIDVKS